MKKVIILATIALLVVTVGWYRWSSLHKEDYGAVLICVANEKPEKLAAGKYAYDWTRLLCAGLDGGFWLGTTFDELYKESYCIVQIIPEGDGVVYYVHKKRGFF